MINYRLSPAPLRRASRLYVTINTDDDEMQVVASHALPISGYKGTVDVPLPPGMESCLAVASPFTFLRVRGDPLAVRLTAGTYNNPAAAISCTRARPEAVCEQQGLRSTCG